MADLGTTDSSRRSRLLALKLATLVREHAGDEPAEPSTWPGGAALIRSGGDAWVLAEDDPQRALGPALAWARQQSATRVNVLAERATGVLARRAALFAEPPAVWHVEERHVLPAIPEPYPAGGDVSEEHERFAALIAGSGAVVHREHGVLTGEVGGLEVCRVVTDPHTGEHRLEVGVGAHDREAFQLIHGDVPTEDSLARIVAQVAEFRRPGADPHPLNRLAKERLLRARIIADPGLVGAESARAVDPPVVRTNVKDAVPCVAAATRADGSTAVVVCSVGVDLDVVPFAADARAFLAGAADDLVIAIPARDDLPVTRALAAMLRRPARIVPIPAGV